MYCVGCHVVSELQTPMVVSIYSTILECGKERERARARERESTDGESPVLRGGSGGASRYQYPLELTQTTQSGWGKGAELPHSYSSSSSLELSTTAPTAPPAPPASGKSSSELRDTMEGAVERLAFGRAGGCCFSPSGETTVFPSKSKPDLCVADTLPKTFA